MRTFTLGIRTKVTICQQAVLPAMVRFREGRRACVECPRAAVDFRVHSLVSLLTSLVPRRSPPAHSTRLGAKCRDVTEWSPSMTSQNFATSRVGEKRTDGYWADCSLAWLSILAKVALGASIGQANKATRFGHFKIEKRRRFKGRITQTILLVKITTHHLFPMLR